MNSAGGASTKSHKGTCAIELDAIADMQMERQCEYLEPWFAQLHEMGRGTEDKLNAIQSDLASLSANIGVVKADIAALKSTVKENSLAVANHETVLHTLELKMADRNRRCNVRIIGLKKGVEGSNNVQYLNRALPEWLPSLQTGQPEIMRAHRIYNGRPARDRPHTLIFNVLCYTARQAILRAAKNDPVTVEGKRVRFAADYSNHTVKRRQAFTQVMDTARERGVKYFLLYPVTLKVRIHADDWPRLSKMSWLANQK